MRQHWVSRLQICTHHLTETIGKVCGFMYDINARKWGKIFLTLFFCILKLRFTYHKTDPFKVYNFIGFISIFIRLYSCCNYLIPEHFYHLPKNLYLFNSHSLFESLFPAPWQKLTYTFCFNRFVYSGHLIYNGIIQYVVFVCLFVSGFLQ